MRKTEAARAHLRPIIEAYAVEHRCSFINAARAIMKHPDHWEMSIKALGAGFRGAEPPSTVTLSKWKDPEKERLAREWPDPSSPVSYEEIEAYLPLHKRKPAPVVPKPKKPLGRPSQFSRAKRLFSFGNSHEAIMKKLNVSKSTVYRWFPVSTPSKDETNE